MKIVARLIAVAALLLLSSSVFADDNVTTLVAHYDRLALGAPVTVTGLAIRNGSMTLTMSGAAAPLKAGDEVIGLFFKGDGTFDYLANDAIELPIMKTNLRNMKSAAKLDASALHGTFHDGLIGAQNVTMPALTGAAAGTIADAFADSRATFANDRESQLATELAQHRLTAPATPYFRAELRGGEEWVYTADHENESLDVLYSFNFDDRSRRTERFETTISERPVGRGRADLPPNDLTLTALDYSVTASADRDVAITATETLQPRRAGMHCLTLYLMDKVYFEDGKPPRHLNLKSVTAADGTPLPFSHHGGLLLVSLPQPTAAGVPIRLKFEMDGDILYRPSGDSYWLLRGGWFPELPLAGMATTVHGVVKVKAPFVPFTGGKTIARKSEGDYNMVETEIDHPVSFVAVAAGKYSFEEEKRGNLTIRTASYAGRNTRAINKINALAHGMIEYYEYFLGPYPGEELNIIEINDFGWGQSPAGMVFITSEAFQPLIGQENQYYSEGINERIAHEIAHQYWGSTVRMPSWEEQWLTESFAEYSAALLLKHFQGDGVYNRLVAHWKADAKESSSVAPIPLANRISNPGNLDRNRFNLLYGKGPYLLAALHKQLGDETFLTFMKSYQKSFHDKNGTTKGVAGLLAFMTKKDFTPFFEQYYWGTEMP